MPLVRSLAFVLMILLAALPARAEEFPLPTSPYSADVTIRSKPKKGEQVTVSGKVHWTQNKERREMRTSQGEMVLILRHDKKVSWMLMPQQKMYMETSTAQKHKDDLDPSDEWRKDNVKVEKLGTETVNGVKATKYKVTVKDEKGRASGGDMWVESHNIPVRMKGFGEEGVEFQLDHTNLEIGKQPDSLFELPKGYQKFGTGGMMPPGAMGAPPGAGQGAQGAPAMPPGMGPGMTKEQAEEFKKRMQEMEKQMRERYGSGGN